MFVGTLVFSCVGLNWGGCAAGESLSVLLEPDLGNPVFAGREPAGLVFGGNEFDAPKFDVVELGLAGNVEGFVNAFESDAGENEDGLLLGVSELELGRNDESGSLFTGLEFVEAGGVAVVVPPFSKGNASVGLPAGVSLSSLLVGTVLVKENPTGELSSGSAVCSSEELASASWFFF